MIKDCKICKMNSPLITIIVPCYNQSAFLNKCLETVIHQTYPHWECLLINDGSTDNTEEICKNWVEKDARFIYYKQKNKGVTKTRDFGLELAKGEWIQFIDADDTLSIHKLEHSLSFSSSANIIISNFAMIFGEEITAPFCDLSASEINFENLISRWDIDFNLPIHCVLINKNLIGDTRFKTSFKANEDWIFWLEIFNKKEISVHFLNEELAYYRHNPEGASKNFQSVFEDNFAVNEYVYSEYGDAAKKLLFDRINRQNLQLKKTNFDQKKYIRQLQNTKIIKLYFSIKKFLNTN